MTGDTVGMALIGTGRMGGFHLGALARSESISIVAAADTDERALAAAASSNRELVTYTDAAGALRHPGVECCLIATSTPSHPALVRLALDAGVHVLCEKPLALDPDEARNLGKEASDAGLVLQVGFWRRFSPPWMKAREAISAGRIGRPLMVRLSQWDSDPPPPEFCDPTVSGGLAVDCGVHEFDLAEWLTGSTITSVRAWSLPLVEPALEAVGDVDNLVAVLRMADDSVATVDLSRNCRYGDDVRTEILGSQGALFIDFLPTARTRIATSEGVRVLEGSETEDATVAGVVAQAEALAVAVRGGVSEGPGAAASARATSVGQAVARSGETGRELDVNINHPDPLEAQ